MSLKTGGKRIKQLERANYRVLGRRESRRTDHFVGGKAARLEVGEGGRASTCLAQSFDAAT